MAQEIVILEVSDRRGAGGSVQCLFLHLLSPKIQDVLGGVVVPTRAADLPPLVTEQNLLSGAELAALDSGDGAFEVVPLYLTPAEFSDLIAASQKIIDFYNSSDFVERLRAKYAFTGARLDG